MENTGSVNHKIKTRFKTKIKKQEKLPGCGAAGPPQGQCLGVEKKSEDSDRQHGDGAQMAK